MIFSLVQASACPFTVVIEQLGLAAALLSARLLQHRSRASHVHNAARVPVRARSVHAVREGAAAIQNQQQLSLQQRMLVCTSVHYESYAAPSTKVVQH